jgi:hypothetical protein
MKPAAKACARMMRVVPIPAKKMPAFDAMTVSPAMQTAYVPAREKLVTMLFQVFRCQGDCAKLVVGMTIGIRA